MKNVAILLSGRGSNFMALADAIDRGELPARIVAVISKPCRSSRSGRGSEERLPDSFYFLLRQVQEGIRWGGSGQT